MTAQTTTSLRAIIYARKSAQSDYKSGDRHASESVDSQIEACTARAVAEGWSLPYDPLKDDGKSAFKSGVEREEFLTLLKYAREGKIDVVLVRAYDRLSRNDDDDYAITSAFLQGGVKIQPLNGPMTDLADANSKAMFKVFQIFANLESENKSFTITTSLASLRAKGRLRASGRIYGWQHKPGESVGTGDNKVKISNMFVEPKEARWVRLAFRYMAQDRTEPKMNRLVEFANDPDNRARYPELAPVKLQNWTIPSVKAVLLNPGVAGFIPKPVQKIKADKDPKTGRRPRGTSEEIAARRESRFAYYQEGRGAWEPIVSEDLYLKVRARIESPSRRRPQGAPYKSLLSGIATCHVCDSILVGGTASRQGKRVHVYRCSSRVDPNKRVKGDKRVHPSPRQELLDADVRLEIILGHLSAPQDTREVANRDDIDTQPIHDELDKVLARRERLTRAFTVLEVMDEAEYGKAMKEANQERDRLQAQLDEARAKNAELSNVPDLRAVLPLLERRTHFHPMLGAVLWTSSTPKHARLLAEAYDALSTDERRELVKRWLTVETAPTEGMTSRWTITHKIATNVHTVMGVDSTRNSLRLLNL